MTSVVGGGKGTSHILDTGDDFIQSHLAKHFPLDQDSVGNELSTQKKVEGAVGEVLQALGQMWDAFMGVLGDVAEAVMDAVNVIVEYIKDIIKNRLEPIFNKIKTAMKNYVMGVISALAIGFENYQETGDVGSSQLNRITNALSGDLFWIIMGSVAAILATLTIVEAISMGAETLIMGVAVPLIAALAIQAFNTVSERKSLGNLPGLNIEDIIEYGKNLDIGESETSLSSNTATMWNKFWGFLGVIFSTWGMIADAIVAVKTDVSGLTAANFAVLFGILSMITGTVSLGLQGDALFIGGTITLGLSILGLGLGLWASKGASGTAKTAGIIAGIFDGIASLLAFEALT